MALTDENGGNSMVMPVQPMYGGGYGNQGGFFGGDWAWLILLLLVGGNGWGFGGFGGMGGMMPWMMGMGAGMGGFGLDYLYPWLNNSQHISDGFRDQNLQTSISGLQNSVTSGFGDVQNAMCNGFGQVQLGIAGINQNICQTGNNVVGAITCAQNALAQQMYQNQLSDLERSFAAQTANVQGMNAIQGQLAQASCDNRAATADVKYTIATEACANRATSTANTQAILDKLCQLELDNYKTQIETKNDTIAQLRSQLQFANLQASQVDQTAQLRTSQATVANQLVSELRSCPIPSQPVYGNQPIFTCGGSSASCECGNNRFAN